MHLTSFAVKGRKEMDGSDGSFHENFGEGKKISGA